MSHDNGCNYRNDLFIASRADGDCFTGFVLANGAILILVVASQMDLLFKYITISGGLNI